MDNEALGSLDQEVNAAGILNAADQVIEREHGFYPSKLDWFNTAYKTTTHRVAAAVAVLGMLVSAGCGNVKSSNYEHNQSQPVGITEVVKIPSPEKGQLRELPSDVLREKDYQELGIEVQVTSTTGLEMYFRKSALDSLPIFQIMIDSKKDHAGKRFLNRSYGPPRLDIVLLGGNTVTPEEINKVPDPNLRDALLAEYERSTDKEFAGAHFRNRNEIRGSRVVDRTYVVVAIGSNEDVIAQDLHEPEKDILGGEIPANPKIYAVDTQKAEVTHRIKHELGHAEEDTEYGADRAAIEQTKKAQEHLSTYNSDALFPIVVVDKNTGKMGRIDNVVQVDSSKKVA